MLVEVYCDWKLWVNFDSHKMIPYAILFHKSHDVFAAMTLFLLLDALQQLSFDHHQNFVD
jgi:hypothetical protein